jgi:hypothetical protein
MIELATIRVGSGHYYEAVGCNEIEEFVEDEKIRGILSDRCRTRKGSTEVLKIIITRNKDGDIVKIWTLEAYYGPFGVMFFIDNP